jgi:hypothetical protein
LEKTPIGDNTENPINHPVVFDGKDQAYIDVSEGEGISIHVEMRSHVILTHDID